MSIRVWLAVLWLLALAVLLWWAFGVRASAVVAGLVAAAGLIVAVAPYLKRPTGFATPPPTFCCSGCKRRGRQDTGREVLFGVAGVVGLSGGGFGERSPRRAASRRA